MSPVLLTTLDDTLYFGANDGFHGYELWRIPVALLPGDADGNGVADFADLVRLSVNFGRDEDVTFADGDFDGTA